LPTVIVGVARYTKFGAFTDQEVLVNTVAPMGVGSVIGAISGGMLIGIIPSAVLKIVFGFILNISAFKVFRKTH
jgi:uncharacterized protein